jgi:ABC-type molybdate transport system substrate-binding protein
MRAGKLLLALCVLSTPWCGKADISLAAPTSWARTVNALVDGWRAGGGDEVTVSYGNSDDQAVEVEAGNRAFDLIIMGDPHALYRLVSKGLSLPALSLASSPIVLAATERDKDRAVQLDAQFPALLGKDLLAIYDPESDGIGVITRDLLSEAGLWEPLTRRMSTQASPNALVRVLKEGGARFAILLRADLANAPTLHEAAVLSGDGQDYTYLAVPVRSRYRPEIARFLGYLRSRQAAELMQKRGFIPRAEQ